MKDQEYYNLVAGGMAVVVVLLAVVWLAMASASSASPAPSPQATAQPAYMYLTIQMNPSTGMPQYSPANFTVPTGDVVFTIIDYDTPANFSACTCNVAGTIGNSETINGVVYSTVPNTNVAHTFNIVPLGLNVLSPGNSTITFEVDLSQAGTYTWECMMPCGADGYTGAPMDVPGFMTGTMTVS